MSAFVFIHGGAHGAWCWQPLFGLLDAPALALDLPGRGRKPADLARVTPDDWADSVLADIERCGLTSVILVAHSMGGLTALRVAQRAPARIARMVFIASPIPEAGKSIVDLMAELPQTGAREEAGSLATGLTEAAARGLLFNGVPEALVQWALPQLTPEAMGPFTAPADLRAAKSAIPRTYIRTQFDKGLPPHLQARAIAQIEPAEVFELDSGHSAMLTHAPAIAAILNRCL
ncbi:MAG: alpha/beta fold hydrolase [Hyphomonadaceae bacterium]